MISAMGKVGRVLKVVLLKYGISQQDLAYVMNIDRNNVHRWVAEKRDPSSDTLLIIISGLKQINPEVAQEFVDLLLDDIL